MSYFTDAERAVYADRKWPKVKCDVCSKQLTDAARSAIVFDYWKANGIRRGTPFIAHYDCFDDGGTYWIALNRIVDWGDEASPHSVRDSFCMWRAHLGDKDWWKPSLESHLCRAWGFANAIVSPKLQRTAPVQRSAHSTERSLVTPSVRARILERDGFRCRRCGNGPQDARLVVDHIEPIAKGGRSTDGNLQTLCEICNIGKGARDPHPHDFIS